jgi:hypothetical protein
MTTKEVGKHLYQLGGIVCTQVSSGKTFSFAINGSVKFENLFSLNWCLIHVLLFTNVHNKLECLSLAGPLSLIFATMAGF